MPDEGGFGVAFETLFPPPPHEVKRPHVEIKTSEVANIFLKEVWFCISVLSALNRERLNALFHLAKCRED